MKSVTRVVSFCTLLYPEHGQKTDNLPELILPYHRGQDFGDFGRIRLSHKTMDKRYQVFVSSTYADLMEERQKVIRTVMEMDCIPAGMELFPAADEEQFRFIKRVIDDCDYYLLIIGGRYGSLNEEGISYTEKEYEYAVSIGLKVIALIHKNPDEIAFGKSEQDPQLREKLGEFRRKVSANRLVLFWESAHELPGLVAQSLAKTIKIFPAVGWVRANKAASEDLLIEINGLRKQNAGFRDRNNELQMELARLSSRPALENLAGLQDKFKLFGTYTRRWRNEVNQHWDVTITWAEMFAAVAPYMASFPNESFVKTVLTRAAFLKSQNDGYSSELDDQLFRTVALQLKALNLVDIEYKQSTTGTMTLFWSLTPYGERVMLELRTVKKVSASEQGADNRESK